MVKLVCEHIYKSFKQGTSHVAVLNNVTIEFEQGVAYAITGVSGTGKSTLMHILAGLDVPSQGAVKFDGRNLKQMNQQQRSLFLNKTVGLMFQSPYLIKELTVLENVIMPGLLGGQQESISKMRGEELLKEVGLLDKSTMKVSALSGGQQQRVALARALFNKPKFLLADEPTGNLDIATAKAIVDLLVRCKNMYNMGLIISTHDTYVAKSMDQQFELANAQLTKL